MDAKNKLARIIATAAALTFATVPSTSSLADTQTTPDKSSVLCYGVNSCKGQSQCQTATTVCKGINSCKGKGIIYMSAKECKQKGGVVKTAADTNLLIN